MDEPLYLFLADLKKSTSLSQSDAERVRLALEDGLRTLNDKLETRLHPLQVNYGDEIAGLFSAPLELQAVINNIRRVLDDHISFRFVVAYGQVGDPTAPLTQMSGPVFKEANDALLALKRQREFADWRISSETTRLSLNALSRAQNAFISDMTDYQRRVHYLLAEGVSGVDIAARLNKDPRSVSYARKASKSDIVLDLDRAIMANLQDIKSGQ